MVSLSRDARPRTRAGSADLLQVLGGIIGPLADALGPDTEVVLHDLSKVPNSIVALGGKLTGRSIGGPITDLLLRHIRQGRSDNLLRYQTHPPLAVANHRFVPKPSYLLNHSSPREGDLAWHEAS